MEEDAYGMRSASMGDQAAAAAEGQVLSMSELLGGQEMSGVNVVDAAAPGASGRASLERERGGGTSSSRGERVASLSYRPRGSVGRGASGSGSGLGVGRGGATGTGISLQGSSASLGRERGSGSGSASDGRGSARWSFRDSMRNKAEEEEEEEEEGDEDGGMLFTMN